MSELEITGTVAPAAVIPPEGGLSAFARQAVDEGMSDSTRRKYAGDWRDFTQWCAESGRQPLPADPETLIEYTTYLCYHRPVRDRGGLIVPGAFGLSPSTVNRALSAIGYFHGLANIPYPRPKTATQVIRGYKKKLTEARDPRARPRKVTAITPKTLAEITGTGLEGAQELTRLRDAAMFYLNYAAATRASELVRVNIEDVREGEDCLIVAVYRMKTRTHSDVEIPEEGSPKTIAAIKRWIKVLAEHGRTVGPLFPRITKHGVIGGGPGSPDGRIVEWSAGMRIKMAAEEAGLEGRYTVHSGRRGLATWARHNGADELDIGRHGGWKDGSPALKGYIDDVDKSRRNPLRRAGI